MAALPAARHEWGEASDVPVVHGRANELAALDRWVCEERCRLVLVLGEGGVGKTTLVARLAHDLAPAFPAVYWRSLRHAPPPEDWLVEAIAALSAAQALPPEGLEARLGLLLELLRARRCLLVLDNLESVLEPGVPDVRYRAGYTGYGEILRRLGASAHKGCLLVTSREQPLRQDRTAVRALRLQGLGVDEARALLRHRDLAGDDAAWGALVARYAGNPLALQVVGETVGTVFGGDIAAFLAQEQPDCHLRAGHALYSVPYRYVGQRLDVRLGARTVTIYAGEVVVATHVRQEGGRATRVEHYPEAGQAFLRGTPQVCLEQATTVGAATARLIRALLDPPTLTHLRQAQALLRLRDPHGDVRLERACQRALACGDGRYQTVRGLLERHLEDVPDEDEDTPAPRATRAFLRGPDAFASACGRHGDRADVGVAV